MFNYDEAIKSNIPGFHGMPKQGLQLRDLREDINSALVAMDIIKETIEKEQNIDSKNLEIINKYSKVIDFCLSEADKLALDLLTEVMSRHQAQKQGLE